MNKQKIEQKINKLEKDIEKLPADNPKVHKLISELETYLRLLGES